MNPYFVKAAEIVGNNVSGFDDFLLFFSLTVLVILIIMSVGE